MFISPAANNHCQCKIPIAIGNLSKIISLDLRDNKVTSASPSSIKKLTKLENNNLLILEIPYWLLNIKGPRNLFLKEIISLRITMQRLFQSLHYTSEVLWSFKINSRLNFHTKDSWLIWLGWEIFRKEYFCNGLLLDDWLTNSLPPHLLGSFWLGRFYGKWKRNEKKGERKWFLAYLVGWILKRKSWWDLSVFFLGPPKCFLPPIWGENRKEKSSCSQMMELPHLSLSFPRCVTALSFFFLSFFIFLFYFFYNFFGLVFGPF